MLIVKSLIGFLLPDIFLKLTRFSSQIAGIDYSSKAIKIAKENGANKIYAVATHALLLGQAKFRILKAGADEIIGTDSIDNEACKVSLSKIIIADYLK